MKAQRITPAIGAVIEGIDLSQPVTGAVTDALYAALLEHQVIFLRDTGISPEAHLALAESFGELDAPHPHYPHVEGFDRIVKLENDSSAPPDTNCWHTDLTFRQVQPFASLLVARVVPKVGGDTMWSSCYAAYDRLPDGMKADLEGLEAVHDLGDFRNSFPTKEQLDEAVGRFGHMVRPLIGTHEVTGAKFLNFNEAFVTHILGLTAKDSHALMTWLAGHMNTPEDQMRWRWAAGDLAIWDNRCTMHYAVADYLPAYRCMNRITVVKDRRAADRLKEAS
ncbi:taurine dioxygenase [Roseovarius faecimaris]|uniref:Taurine dioxygenase n=1 Tax=Roseovarius faecimaris TaxID=2494550 RepID=A0A6I6IMM9_9RHOB|nr:TauD/TfdA family dioxygenase [Roseovarius faecimaris]QGX98269.1 taurine dioxygenase [Roseovarius faecimaris]